MKRYQNAFRLIPIVIKMAYKVFFVSELYHLPWLKKRVKQIENDNNEQLPDYHKRFRIYIMVNTFCISWLETLRNQSYTKIQCETSLLFCGLSPLFDDLFDEMAYTDKEIYLLTEKKIQRGNLHEKICIALVEQIEQRRNDYLSRITFFKKVIDYQLISKKQFDKNITHDEMIDITFGKGGYASLFCLEAILPNVYSSEEVAAFYQMGGIIQLMDDIFDVYEDHVSGIMTMATTTKDMNALRQYCDAEVRKNIAQFEALPYPKRNIDAFLLQYRFILSRGWVALDQLQALQMESKGIFDLQNYTRKQLICDMELWGNIKKSLIYTIS